MTGTTPAFNSALFRAIALLPGIEALGQMTAHSGATGLGFRASSSNATSGPTGIIVDPSTGLLLEASNVPEPSLSPIRAFANLGPSRNPSAIAGGYVQWVDPVGSPSVVARSSVPSNLPLPTPPTAQITAAAKPGTPYAPINTLQYQLYKEFGNVDDPYGYAASATGGVMTFTFTGSQRQLQSFLSDLRGSSIVASVKVISGNAGPTG